ncbi:MAG: DUF1800 domain-containing protein [Candidatus Thermochlorobacter sp.]
MMKKSFYLLRLGLITTVALLLVNCTNTSRVIQQPTSKFTSSKPALKLPYKDAGLSERQAAAHLLDRLAFGARPDEVDKVVKIGVERWVESQLSQSAQNLRLTEKLAPLKTLTMSSAEIVATYPNPGILLAQAYRDGIISRDDTLKANRAELRRKIMDYYRKEGVRAQRELISEMQAQKILRAVYSENQLEEVLTDFWFNHFNVSITNNKARVHVFSFERDAIRPHVLGKFRNMLGATAKHPAMLLYLDNAQSSAPEGAPTTLSKNLERYRQNPFAAKRMDAAMARQRTEIEKMKDELPDVIKQQLPKRGINENYARELMELHTLGVDGGYTQKDVVEVARALTGWTVFPQGKRAERLHELIERGKWIGVVQEGDFLFRPDAHDAGEKHILGVTFPAGGGKEEGEKVLDMLAAHPATARLIATKLARRFVCDEPPTSLIEKLTQTFMQTGGDLKAVMRTLVESPEFWSKEARRAKIKSPFEYVVSALRALDADISSTRELARWSEKQGQPLYAYQAPTGYPDRAEFWVNSGALLNRMNFGLRLALGRIRGVKFDLLALNHNHEPESLEEALNIYAVRLMPERDLSETLRRLMPLIKNPDFAEKISRAAPPLLPKQAEPQDTSEAMAFNSALIQEFLSDDPESDNNEQAITSKHAALANVVGIILGSPEFQRR